MNLIVRLILWVSPQRALRLLLSIIGLGLYINQGLVELVINLQANLDSPDPFD
jgi:hypothetical protein